MKYSRFCCLALCVCVLFCGLFSIPASAEAVNIAYEIDTQIFDRTDTSNVICIDSQEGIVAGELNGAGKVYTNYTVPEKLQYMLVLAVYSGNNVIFNAGENVSFRLENLSAYFEYNDTAPVFSKTANTLVYYLVYSDGTTSSVVTLDKSTNLVYDSEKGTQTILFNFTAEKDVKRIVITEYSYAYSRLGSWITGKTFDRWHVAFGFDHYPFVITTDIQSEEAGLLSGILGKITEGFSNIGTWFAELPGKIWGAISDGLTALFVPDTEYMTGYQDKWDDLLSDKLGAIYQVGSIVIESWEQIKESDTTNTIEMPEVTINLSDNNSFSFGGYNVAIVPEGFNGVVDILKLIVGILVSVAFINGLLKRYDEVMGVET